MLMKKIHPTDVQEESRRTSIVRETDTERERERERGGRPEPLTDRRKSHADEEIQEKIKKNQEQPLTHRRKSYADEQIPDKFQKKRPRTTTDRRTDQSPMLMDGSQRCSRSSKKSNY